MDARGLHKTVLVLINDCAGYIASDGFGRPLIQLIRNIEYQRHVRLFFCELEDDNELHKILSTDDHIDRVILGGSHYTIGDDAPDRIIKINNDAIDHCIKHSIPLLGICFGFQAIAVHVAHASLVKNSQFHDQNVIVRDLDGTELVTVVEKHGYRVENVDETKVSILATAHCENSNDRDCEVSIIQSATLTGIHFHVVGTEAGKTMLHNFVVTGRITTLP
jgi:GMP synthase-like glutamine amidotransferase